MRLNHLVVVKITRLKQNLLILLLKNILYPLITSETFWKLELFSCFQLLVKENRSLKRIKFSGFRLLHSFEFCAAKRKTINRIRYYSYQNVLKCWRFTIWHCISNPGVQGSNYWVDPRSVHLSSFQIRPVIQSNRSFCGFSGKKVIVSS